jgi:hypothetical protein
MRLHDQKSCTHDAGSMKTPRLIWAVNVMEVSKKRAETVVLVVVQAAPPAARFRADAAHMAGSLDLFKVKRRQGALQVISK